MGFDVSSTLLVSADCCDLWHAEHVLPKVRHLVDKLHTSTRVPGFKDATI